MICERIKNLGSAKFAKICMKWLKSNDQTLTVKNRDGDREENTTYFRIQLDKLEYIYETLETPMRRDPTDGTYFMMYNAVYSPADKICVFDGFFEQRQSVISKEERVKEETLGFYEKATATKKFNEAFKRTFLPIFVTKYQDKVTYNENPDYLWEVTKTYLQRGKEVSLLELFCKELKKLQMYELIYVGLYSPHATEADQILIDFIAKGQTEEAMKQFTEKVLTAYEEDCSNVFAEIGHKFEVELKHAKGIYDALKTYCPTENEKLTRSMCQAYATFFKDKEPPEEIQITVMGTNKNRRRLYKRNNIDIEEKIMTMKVIPDQLASPYQAFQLNWNSYISDFTSKDFPVEKDDNGRIVIPFDCIYAENVLKIEYDRKTIWEKPKKTFVHR